MHYVSLDWVLNEHRQSVLYSVEKCSKASAGTANFIRFPSALTRQQSDRKMDFVFKTKFEDVEIGCGECALVGGINNTTKEFQDAGFKMLKVMRDMLYQDLLLSYTSSIFLGFFYC